ncbi:AMP-binding protein [Acetobacter fallax]|uniref:AMP-binding protein n=1 Tax=Acetobacter fallax TaxID=1737473 RepID=A0ABX0KCB6_9PROT|nr:AMP-binding protein [Acetobacter fallax]NHO34089.1 AMP-binding protein [Acetobacter fallax]NHO37611.1 AMP-binding protein [Acetobacter fallax]
MRSAPASDFQPETADLSLVFSPDRSVFSHPDGTVSTGHDLLRAAHRTAALLPDAPIVSLCQDVWHFTVLFLATILRGQSVLLSSDRTPERLGQLAASRNAVCVTLKGDSATEELPPGTLTLPAPDGSGTDHPDNPVILFDREVATVFTSGSTGQPMAYAKKWGALVIRSIVARELLDPEETASSLTGTVPPYHMYGFETLVCQAVHTRSLATTGPTTYPADWRKMLELTTAPRILITTPLQMRALLRADLDIPPIARIVSAAAPLGEDLARRTEEALHTVVTEIYGATEIGSIAIRRTTVEPVWKLYDTVDLHDDSVTVSAPGAPDIELADLVEQRDARHFRLIGRRNDMVKIAARRASLSMLNTILTNLPGVEDGAFVPPNTDDGHTARMQVLAVAPGVSAAGILASLRKQIDPVFLPRTITFVEAMPRNSVGKLTAGALREFATTVMEGQIIGEISFPADHPAFPGHFPGQPVVPGALLLDCGLELAGLNPTKIDQVKFLRPVRPEETLRFRLRQENERRTLTARMPDHPGAPLALRAVIRTQSD